MRTRWPLVILALYLVVGLALFYKCLDNPFIMDDENQITLNPFIQDISLWPRYFLGSTMGAGGPENLNGVYYKPIMTSYYAVIWHFFGHEPEAFRWPLLVMHILNAWMVAILLGRFMRQSYAAALGLIFLIHPLNTEIVAYIANAQDSLYLFFGLLSILIFNLFQSQAAVPAAAATLALSLLSKETGALFFILTPLYVYFFNRDRFKPLAVSVCLIAFTYGTVRWLIGMTSVHNPILKLHNASVFERWKTLPSLSWHYVNEYFWSLDTSLARDYVIKDLEFINFWIPLIALIVLSGLVTIIISSSKSQTERYALYFFVAIIGAWFALHSHIIVPLDGTVADRWFYLGQIGVLGILGIVACRIPITKYSTLFMIIMTLIFASFAAKRSWERLDLWSTPIKLYQADFDRFPEDPIMANNIGVELFRAGNFNQAKIYFEKASLLNATWAVPLNNLGAIEEALGKRDQALRLYGKAITLDVYPLAYENYARLLCSLQQQENMCRDFLTNSALRLFPRNQKLLDLARHMNITVPN